MTTNEMIHLVIGRERGMWSDEILSITNLENAANNFANNCFEDIVKYYDTIDIKGFKASFGCYKMLGYGMAGRLMFTISDEGIEPNNSVTVLGTDEISSSKPGLHGVDGNIDEIIKMLYEVTRNWYSIKKEFEPNKEVSII